MAEADLQLAAKKPEKTPHLRGRRLDPLAERAHCLLEEPLARRDHAPADSGPRQSEHHSDPLDVETVDEPKAQERSLLRREAPEGVAEGVVRSVAVAAPDRRQLGIHRRKTRGGGRVHRDPRAPSFAATHLRRRPHRGHAEPPRYGPAPRVSLDQRSLTFRCHEELSAKGLRALVGDLGLEAALRERLR